LAADIGDLIPEKFDDSQQSDFKENSGEKFLALISLKLGDSFTLDLGKKQTACFKDMIRRMIDNSFQDLIRLMLGESFYRSVLQAYLAGLGIMILPELESGLGRADKLLNTKIEPMLWSLKTADDPPGDLRKHSWEWTKSGLKVTARLMITLLSYLWLWTKRDAISEPVFMKKTEKFLSLISIKRISPIE
jgi:hypothetical protein